MEDKPKYEQIETIQQAINMCVAENRPIRFKSKLSNAELKKGIVDKRNCKLLKPSKDSDEVAIVPYWMEDFDFNEVDTKVTLYSADGGKLV